MKRRSQEGIILVEVMLALVILTAGSMVIFQSYRSSLQVIRHSKDLYDAALAVESRISELEITGHLDEAKGLLEQGLYSH